MGVTLLSEDNVCSETLISLMASGIVPTTDGVGVPRTDRTSGVDAEGVETRALPGPAGEARSAGESEGVET